MSAQPVVADPRDVRHALRAPGLLREFNVYRWAGRMLLDAAVVRRRARFAGRTPVATKHTRAADDTSAAALHHAAFGALL